MFEQRASTLNELTREFKKIITGYRLILIGTHIIESAELARDETADVFRRKTPNEKGIYLNNTQPRTWPKDWEDNTGPQKNGYMYSGNKSPKICGYYFPLNNYPKKRTASGIIKKGRKHLNLMYRLLENQWKC